MSHLVGLHLIEEDDECCEVQFCKMSYVAIFSDSHVKRLGCFEFN